MNKEFWRFGQWFSLLILAWLFAWNLRLYLGTVFAFSSLGEFTYWLVAKLILWWMLTLWLLKPLPTLKKLLTSYVSQGFAWGLGASAALVIVNIVLTYFLKISWQLHPLTIGFISAVLLAPILEEFVFRGVLLPKLITTGLSFWKSNVLTTLMFVGLHVPGWYFQGQLGSGSILITVTSITLLSLLFGFVQHKSKSLWAAVIVHGVNNFLASMLQL